MSDLTFTVSLDRTQFKKQVEEVRRDILGLSNITKSETSKMDSSFRDLSIGIAGYFSANMIQGFVTQLINVRGEFQKTEIAFATMLGNGDQAKSLMNDMVNLAAKTPFSLQDVSSGAKQLLAFQVPANEVVDTLTRLGNIAAGLSVPLSRINLVYGQVKAKGRLMGDDLRQFTEAGIPMVAELAKKFNTTTSAITEMVSAGKIGFNDVKDVLFSMTNEGGMFYNLMEKQSKSLSGQIANLGDAWDQMLNKIGEANEGILSDGIQGLTYLVQNYEDVIQVVGTLVATYGAYKAALIAANALNKASIFIESTAAAVRFAQGISGMTKAQLLFNSAASANPYVFMAAGIAALIGAIVYYKTGAEEAASTTKQLNDALDNAYNESGREIAKLTELYNKTKDLKLSVDERKKAVSELQKLYPSYFGNLDAEAFKTGKAKDAYNELRDAIIASAKARAAQAEIDRRAGEYLKQREKIIKKRDSFISDMNNASDREVSTGEGTIIIEGDDVRDKNRKKAITAQNEAFQLDKKFEEDNKQLLDFKDENEKRASKLEKDKNSRVAESNSTKEEEIKAIKNHNRELAEVYSKGSIADLEQRISLWNEAKEKSVGDSVSVLGKNKYGDTINTGQIVTLKAANEEIAKLEAEKAKRIKEIQKLSFDEQINELKRQFSVRDQLLQSGYSKDVVDGMFPEIKDKNLIQSLQEQAKALNDILTSGKGNEETAVNFTNLNEQIRVLLGQKSELENFSKLLNDGKQGKSSSEYIAFLDSQKTTGGTEQDAAKNAEIDRRIEYEKQAIADAYNSFVEAHLSYEQQKTKITKDYDELRKQAKTQAELDAIDKAQKKDLSALALKEFQNSDAWVKGFENLENLSNAQLDKIIENFQKFKDEVAKTLSPADLKAFQDALQRLTDTSLQRNPFKFLSNAVKEYVKDSKEGKDATASFKDVAKGISASADLVNSAISSGLEVADSLGIQMSDSIKEVIQGVQTTLGGVSDLASGIASMNPTQIIKGIAGVVKGMAQIFNGDRKKERQIKAWANEVANLKVQYQELERAIDKALGDDKYNQQLNVIANLEKQKILLEKMIKAEQGKKKTDGGKINDWKEQISDINNKIADLKDSIVNDILQIDTKGLADKIGDALIEGFGRGEDALQSLNKTADEVFKDMVKNALKMELEKKMQPIIDNMLKAMGYGNNDSVITEQIKLLEKQRDAIKLTGSYIKDITSKQKVDEINKAIADLKTKLGVTTGSFDGLTPEEREAIKAQIVAATGDYQKAMEQYADLFGSDASTNTNGLKGDIKGITEKTAGALEGQINAIRIYQVEALNIAKNNQKTFLEALKYQAEIAINTRELKAIRQGIDDLVIKVKKL